jgi:hypothetical protein
MVKLLHLLYAEQQQQLQATQERQRREEEDSRRLLNFFYQQNAKAGKEEEETLTIFLALGYLGAPGYCSIQTYLTQSDIPCNPMLDSAWASLWRSQSDRAFITTMGLDVTTFDDLLGRFADRWNFSTIDWANVNRHGKPQIGRRLLDASGCLGLVLHWLCLTMASYTLQQLFAITPAVCLRYLLTGLQHLLLCLREHPQARFLWPTTKDKAPRHSKQIERKFPCLTNCIGFVDGVNLPVSVSADEE